MKSPLSFKSQHLGPTLLTVFPEMTLSFQKYVKWKAFLFAGSNISLGELLALLKRDKNMAVRKSVLNLGQPRSSESRYHQTQKHLVRKTAYLKQRGASVEERVRMTFARGLVKGRRRRW